jgi:hypothetical protein
MADHDQLYQRRPAVAQPPGPAATSSPRPDAFIGDGLAQRKRDNLIWPETSS